MSFINVSNDAFNELLSAVETCKRWGFYNLEHQYSFVEKALINWSSVNHIEKSVLNVLIYNIKEIYNPEYCVVFENKKLIEINDTDKVNQYYISKGYSVVQLTIPDRIEKDKMYLISKFKVK